MDEETLLNRSMVELVGQKLQDRPCAVKRTVNTWMEEIDESMAVVVAAFVAAVAALVEMMVALSRIRLVPPDKEQFCN